jgi:hypothetical protein
MSLRLDGLHRECRRRGWKLRAAMLRLTPDERVVQLQVQTSNHNLGAPPGLAIDDQARFLARHLWITERR